MLALVFVFAAGALAVGVLLSSIVLRQTEEYRRLRDEAVETTGQITRVWRTRGDKPRHMIGYEFDVQGRTYRGEQRVSARSWPRYRSGSNLPIRYVSSDPSIHAPRDLGRGGIPMWVPPLATLALAAAAWLCFLQIRGQRHLLVEGRPAPAVVRDHKKGQHGITYHYEFPLLAGSNYSGKKGPEKKPPAVGATICVLYDPDNPKDNAPYPLSLVRPRPR